MAVRVPQVGRQNHNGAQAKEANHRASDAMGAEKLLGNPLENSRATPTDFSGNPQLSLDVPRAKCASSFSPLRWSTSLDLGLDGHLSIYDPHISIVQSGLDGFGFNSPPVDPPHCDHIAHMVRFPNPAS